MDAGSQQTLPDSLGLTATRQPQLNPRELPLGNPGCRPRGKPRSFLYILKSFPDCRLLWLKNIYQLFGKYVLFLEIENATLLSKEGHTVSWINSPASSQCHCARSVSIFCGTLDPCLLQAEMAQKVKNKDPEITRCNHLNPICLYVLQAFYLCEIKYNSKQTNSIQEVGLPE